MGNWSNLKVKIHDNPWPDIHRMQRVVPLLHSTFPVYLIAESFAITQNTSSTTFPAYLIAEVEMGSS